MVNGRVLYRNGEYTTINPKLVIERARKEASLLLERAAAAQKA